MKGATAPWFQFQQILLDSQAARITGQFSIGSNDPVAGNDDADGVLVVGMPHGPAG